MSEDAFLQIKKEPVRREGLAEKVLHRILGLIRSGNLKAGDKLPSERNLMEIFAVSRPPIREALSALSILGVVESRHGGRASITDLDAQKLLSPLDFFLSISDLHIADMFQCRRLIECEVASLAARSSDEDGKKELVKLLAAQKQISEAVSFRIADKEFHEKISQLAGNEMLSRLNDGLYNLGLEIRRKATEDKNIVLQSIKEHGKIVDAICKSDPVKASEAMRRHLNSIETTTQELYSKMDLSKK